MSNDIEDEGYDAYLAKGTLPPNAPPAFWGGWIRAANEVSYERGERQASVAMLRQCLRQLGYSSEFRVRKSIVLAGCERRISGGSSLAVSEKSGCGNQYRSHCDGACHCVDHDPFG